MMTFASPYQVRALRLMVGDFPLFPVRGHGHNLAVRVVGDPGLESHRALCAGFLRRRLDRYSGAVGSRDGQGFHHNVARVPVP